jgi:benzoyl-CoA reductase subunit D
MAERLLKLLKSIEVRQGVVMMTGGLALDTGLVQALSDGMEKQKMGTQVATHPDSLYAGAIGAALWGAFRHEKLKALGRLPKAS